MQEPAVYLIHTVSGQVVVHGLIIDLFKHFFECGSIHPGCP